MKGNLLLAYFQGHSDGMKDGMQNLCYDIHETSSKCQNCALLQTREGESAYCYFGYGCITNDFKDFKKVIDC
jgi:hypothetical protein